MVTKNARARAVAALVERLTAAEEERDRLKKQIATICRVIEDRRNLADYTAFELADTLQLTLYRTRDTICTHCEAAKAAGCRS